MIYPSVLAYNFHHIDIAQAVTFGVGVWGLEQSTLLSLLYFQKHIVGMLLLG